MIFCMKITIKVFYRLILLILVGMDRHAQITQNNMFLQNLCDISRKNLGMKLNFWADEHQHIL